MGKKVAVFFLIFVLLLSFIPSISAFAAETETGITAPNPVIWADVPDADVITLDSISDKKPGDSVVISGTTTFDETTIKVISPNTTVLYLDVVKGTPFITTFDLPNDAKEGTYTVIAGQGSEVATITFDVSNEGNGGTTVSVSEVSLDKTSATVKVGETLQLSARVFPTDATNKAVIWSSSDETVATVDQYGKVTAKKAGSATITVTTKDGNFSDQCTVTVNEKTTNDGKPSGGGGSSSGGSSNTTKEKPKEEVKQSEQPKIPEQPKTSGNLVAFKDVENHWAKEAIEKLVEKNIIGGYPDGSFKPNNEINRAEFITLVCRMLNLEPINGESAFKDIKSDAWYIGYVNAIKKAGIVGGYEDGTFRPNQEITREEAFVILYRMAKDKLNTSKSSNHFADEEGISAWAKEAVNALVDSGIVGGYEDGTIKPKNNITRAETAKILSYFLQ